MRSPQGHSPCSSSPRVRCLKGSQLAESIRQREGGKSPLPHSLDMFRSRAPPNRPRRHRLQVCQLLFPKNFLVLVLVLVLVLLSSTFLESFLMGWAGPGTPEVASPVASEKTSKRSFADVNEMYASWYSMGGSPKSSPSSPNKTSRRTDRMARQDRRLSEEGHDGVDAGVPERTREEEQGHQHRLCEEKQGDGEGAHRMHESDASLDEVLAVGFKEIELAYHQLIAEQLAGCEGCACPGHIEAFMSLARVRLRGMGEEVQRRGCQRGQMVFTDLAFNILLQMSGCHVEGQGEADALNVRKALTGGWSSCVEEILRTFDEEHEFKQPMMNQ
eukprot:746495-Hanusia_phi.AAC.2